MNLAFLCYDGMTALDFVGPHEILSRLPHVTVQTISLQAGPVYTHSKLKLIADVSYTEVSSADVLIVPGAGNATTRRDHPEHPGTSSRA
jgi:putative intracellular protease/amidase